MPWTFYPAFIGTAVSIAAWSYFAWREHVTHIPRTLSELAAETPGGLRYYRTVLWVCGPLFAITTIAYIAPRMHPELLVGGIAAITIVTELLIGLLPAARGKITLHDYVAAAMGFGMAASAYLYAWNLSGALALAEYICAALMSILALLTFTDRKRYLFYELPFIYIGHVSVLIAALGV